MDQELQPLLAQKYAFGGLQNLADDEQVLVVSQHMKMDCQPWSLVPREVSIQQGRRGRVEIYRAHFDKCMSPLSKETGGEAF